MTLQLKYYTSLLFTGEKKNMKSKNRILKYKLHNVYYLYTCTDFYKLWFKYH